MPETTIRLPADLAERVDQVAELERRSRNNAAVKLIDEALASRAYVEQATHAQPVRPVARHEASP
jgi:predicted transcriptional regulator